MPLPVARDGAVLVRAGGARGRLAVSLLGDGRGGGGGRGGGSRRTAYGVYIMYAYERR